MSKKFDKKIVLASAIASLVASGLAFNPSARAEGETAPAADTSAPAAPAAAPSAKAKHHHEKKDAGKKDEAKKKGHKKGCEGKGGCGGKGEKKEGASDAAPKAE